MTQTRSNKNTSINSTNSSSILCLVVSILSLIGALKTAVGLAITGQNSRLVLERQFSVSHRSRCSSRATRIQMSSQVVSTTTTPSWSELQQLSYETTSVGNALEKDQQIRRKGGGEAHVSNTLRLFDSNDEPKFTLFRDAAGWCPYCQKTMLLIEEKKIPIRIQTVPMRSYGDKPTDFTRLVPNGLLPALLIHPTEQSTAKIMTESQLIMEFLDREHPPSKGYRPMLPTDTSGVKRYQYLTQLERELFRWWCTLLFRSSRNDKEEQAVLQGFIDTLQKVDQALQETNGPWFFDTPEGPTMIDFIYISHIERMLASCAYWKGLDIRTKWKGIQTWLDAFDTRPSYLAFKSDFYTNVMDIPPQYGPGYDGGLESHRETFKALILGRGQSWKLPLPHDDELQPLYNGLPLPLCALEAGGILDYAENPNPKLMAKACRHAAGWKLASNGSNVARFAARGGSRGSKNPRKGFAAPLADPYADPDSIAMPRVDEALRIVCRAMLLDDDDQLLPLLEHELTLLDLKEDVVKSLAYLRDRIGVPRDMPLTAARQFRAYLNWAIDIIAK